MEVAFGEDSAHQDYVLGPVDDFGGTRLQLLEVLDGRVEVALTNGENRVGEIEEVF